MGTATCSYAGPCTEACPFAACHTGLTAICNILQAKPHRCEQTRSGAQSATSFIAEVITSKPGPGLQMSVPDRRGSVRQESRIQAEYDDLLRDGIDLRKDLAAELEHCRAKQVCGLLQLGSAAAPCRVCSADAAEQWSWSSIYIEGPKSTMDWNMPDTRPGVAA